MPTSAAVTLCILLAAASAAPSTAMASNVDTGNASCDQLQKARSDALSSRNMAVLDQAATAYIQQCRTLRSKIEIAQAMAEVAATRRAVGQKQEALKQAQQCIQFEYLALGCHLEKALALDALGMKVEAREVIATAREVIDRLRDAGDHL